LVSPSILSPENGIYPTIRKKRGVFLLSQAKQYSCPSSGPFCAQCCSSIKILSVLHLLLLLGD